MAEKTYNITLTANHQSLTAEYLPLAAESVQYLTAKVVCETEDWTGREIKAMFEQGCMVYEVPVTGGEITAKQQLNLTAGDWHVWLVGNSARDGEVIPRITTNVAHISVAPTGGTEGNPFPIMPPTVEEQLRADMGNLADLTTEDKSSLVAAINEAAESGSKDAVTYTPQTLTEEQKSQARTNIGALDVNIKTTPVDIGVGRGNRIYYVQSGWLKPCPDNADKELILHYRRVFEFIGSQRIEPSSQNILLEAKSAYALYQKGLASESIVVTNNPLRAAQVYVTWNITTANNKHYFYYAQVSTAYYYDCTYCVEDDALTSERYQSPVYRTAYGVGKQDSVSQFRMRTNPTEDMNIATKQYVDTAKTEAQQLGLTTATPGKTIKVKTVQNGKPTEWETADIYEKPTSGIPKSDLAQSVQTSLAKADAAISLGLTAATPGQIIKVKAVQDGKPTEWEAVDMPSGGVEWYEVIDMETAENVNDLVISTDKNGRPISGYHALAMTLCFMIPADSTQTSTHGNIWVYPVVNNYLSGEIRTIITVSSWKTIARTSNFLFAGSNRVIFISSANSANTFEGSYNNVFNGIRLYINNAGDHLPIGTKVRCLVLSKGWTA